MGNLDVKNDFDPVTHKAKNAYFMRAPSIWGAPSIVRMFKVVLVWNSKILFKSTFPLPTLGSVLAVDLDLEVTDMVTRGVVGSSRSWDYTYEVTEFMGCMNGFIGLMLC